MIETFETQWGGRTLTIEIGRYAAQANASCTVRYGDTVVLGTCVRSDNKREGIDYFPLMCDYEERLYAAGKIKGSRFIKREGRPTDEAILTARMIDRSIRPLFDDRMRNDVQVITTALSVDMENDSDIPAMVAASCVLSISNIPWDGPIGGIRVGRVASEDGQGAEWVINPTFSAREKSELDLIVAGTTEKVIMVEAGAKEVPEAVMMEGVAFAQKHLAEVIALIKDVTAKAGKPKHVIGPTTDEEAQALNEKSALLDEAKSFILPRIRESFFNQPRASKDERRATREALTEELEKHLIEKNIGKDKRAAALDAIYGWIEAEVTRSILEEDRRVDGRRIDEVRQLTIEVGLLPRTHGSGHFLRGETQVLSTVTLGAPSMEQTLDGMETSGKKRYMHHYNFPPYSVGEVGPLRGPSRRDIGHGALAERALLPVLPPKEIFPYTIRVVSEVFGSNGSSSMASSCGSTLSLMDAGVPISAPVAGIAMGLASNEKTGAYKILTDLQDLEDGKGGMDFKITGTRKGITAIQMDTKTRGLTPEIVNKTFTQAYTARLQILDAIEKVLPAPRPELSQYAPRIITIQINPEKIRDVIGPGGKVINEIIDKTGVEIDIEQTGLVLITSVSAESAQRAVEWIQNLTREVKAGEVFEGKVTRLMDFGAFVEVLPNQEGLVHISEMAPFRVRAVGDVVAVGDVIPVKVIEIDAMGRINLSLKQAPGYTVEKYGKGAEKFANDAPPPRTQRPGGGGHSDRRPRF